MHDLIYSNAFGEDPRKGRPLALLPYPFTQRQDILVTFPFDVELVQSKTPHVANTVGELGATVSQTGPRSIHWHLDLVIANTHLDSSLYAMYDAILQALKDRTLASITVKNLSDGSSESDPQQSTPLNRR